jgi:hypothetical protein
LNGKQTERAEPEDGHPVANLEPSVVNGLERDRCRLEQDGPFRVETGRKKEPRRGIVGDRDGVRVAVWKRRVHDVPNRDPAYLGADGADCSHPLVARAHWVWLRVGVLLEQAQVHVEALPGERRNASVEGELRAVADAADDRRCPHLIGLQRGILVMRQRDRTRRREEQLIRHGPAFEASAWTTGKPL